MMKTMYKRGFTLIELLVVIAIIGILASVVLASLNSARDKGNEAKIASQLSSARAAAEIYYSNNNNSYGGTSGSHVTSCASTMFADANSGMAQYTNTINYPGGTTLVCDSMGTAYAMRAAFTSNGTAKYWCVDSAGRSVVGTTTALDATDSDCAD